jgi:hypothetical protein
VAVLDGASASALVSVGVLESVWACESLLVLA